MCHPMCLNHSRAIGSRRARAESHHKVDLPTPVVFGREMDFARECGKYPPANAAADCQEVDDWDGKVGICGGWPVGGIIHNVRLRGTELQIFSGPSISADQADDCL